MKRFLSRLNSIYLIGCLSCCLAFTGCVRDQSHLPSITTPPQQAKIGVYHKVQRGQTLWKISKAYGVSVDELVKENSIPNVAKLEESQLIFIPGAENVLDIPVVKGAVTTEFGWPVRGEIISYFSGARSDNSGNGIHIAAQEGTVVSAAREGQVVFADFLNGYANTVIIDHLDGYFTVYAQNSVLLVKNGDLVKKSAPIAKVGRTGPLAFLHFEVRKDSEADNPLYYLP